MFENGVGKQGETIDTGLHDQYRIDYYNNYISNLGLAITEDGVNVQSYFAWSIMDNFEWADGYNSRFGMVFIDYDNDQARHPKDSLTWYSTFIKNNSA